MDGGCYESYYAYHGVDWKQIRHGHFSDNRLSKIGIVGATPVMPKDNDNAPFKVNFDFFTCRQKNAVS